MDRIIRQICYVVAAALAFVAGACGEPDRFTVECHIDGLGSGQVEMIYYNGAVERVMAHGVDDEVTFHGSSVEPAIVRVVAADGRELFTVIARNGDKIKVKMNLDTPGEAECKGNEATEELSAFVRENSAIFASADRDSINSLIARHVSSRPDRMASAVILMTMYDFSVSVEEGDSLLALLSPEARAVSMGRNFSMLLADKAELASSKIIRPITVFTGRDTLLNFVPHRSSYGILAIMTGEKSDTLRRLLRRLRAEYPERRLEIFEISVDPDSALWRSRIATDSAHWKQGWLMGGTANPSIRNLAISRLPLFIAVDSAGRQLYRGPVAEQAVEQVTDRLTRPSADTR